MSKDPITGKEHVPAGPESGFVGDKEPQVYIGRCDVPACLSGATSYTLAKKAFEILVDAATFPDTGVFPLAGQSGAFEGLRVQVKTTGRNAWRLVGSYTELDITNLNAALNWKVVRGFYCAAEFQLIDSSTNVGGTDCGSAVIQLKETKDAGHSGDFPNRAFIRIRSDGRLGRNLFNIENESSVTAADATSMVCAVGAAAVAGGVAIRCVVAGVPVWLLGSLTAPA